LNPTAAPTLVSALESRDVPVALPVTVVRFCALIFNAPPVAVTVPLETVTVFVEVIQLSATAAETPTPLALSPELLLELLDALELWLFAFGVVPAPEVFELCAVWSWVCWSAERLFESSPLALAATSTSELSVVLAPIVTDVAERLRPTVVLVVGLTMSMPTIAPTATSLLAASALPVVLNVPV
jgi:hypothetical protein